MFVLRENMHPLIKPPVSKIDNVAHALRRPMKMIQQNSYILTNGVMMVKFIAYFKSYPIFIQIFI